MARIAFGSPEAAAVLKADRALRIADEEKAAGKKWYIVAVEETLLVNWRVRARDEDDAMDRCMDDGERINEIDCTDFSPEYATLDKNQDD